MASPGRGATDGASFDCCPAGYRWGSALPTTAAAAAATAAETIAAAAR